MPYIIACRTRIKIVNQRFMLNQLESDCIYHFTIYFEPNGIPSGSKPIENGSIQSDYSWFNRNQKRIGQSLELRWLNLIVCQKRIIIMSYPRNFSCMPKAYNYNELSTQLFVAFVAHREILLNQPEIRLYLPLSDWFGSKRTYVWF